MRHRLFFSAFLLQEASSQPKPESPYSKVRKMSKVATYDNPASLSSDMELFKVLTG